MTKFCKFTGSYFTAPPIDKKLGNQWKRPKCLFSTVTDSLESGTIGELVGTSAPYFCPYQWLRSVLRDDVVPLSVVVARARMDSVDMQSLWFTIKESCIQQNGLNGARYLKLPKAIWGIPKDQINGKEY